MARKGSKLSAASTEAATWLAETLSGLGEVEIKRMFSGYGLFESGVMFALVDSDGLAHLRRVPGQEEQFRALGSRKHPGMPYWSIPDEVLTDSDKLVSWSRESLIIAQAKRSGPRRRKTP